MATAPAFDATAWITQNTFGGTELRLETFTAVSNFTVMWNLFEGVLCRNRANVPEFERLAQALSPADFTEEDAASVNDCLAFWSFRYRTPDGMAARFDGLNFRPKDRRELVEEVLRGSREALSDKALALMIIVYRLRNNLFHGLKTVETLNDQIHNLNTGCHFLGTLLQVSRTYLVQRQSRYVSQR